MLVFLVLGMTAGFTVFWRRFMLVCAAVFYFKSGELLAPFCFFSGAILAEISLNQSKTPVTFPPPRDATERVYQIVYEHWPIGLAMLGLLLASVPPENQHFVWYSRVIYYWFDNHITTSMGARL